MIEQVYKCDFIKRFDDIRPNQFSRKGLTILFNYLEMLEDDTSEQIEFDCIALCCEFVEYENKTEFAGDYGHLFMDSLFDDLSDLENSEILEILEDKTYVLCFDEDCILFQQF
tara:strand:+ start:104 stop:442 length:339 start_codon:yes stop_codon:yes gene_type:complete